MLTLYPRTGQHVVGTLRFEMIEISNASRAPRADIGVCTRYPRASFINQPIFPYNFLHATLRHYRLRNDPVKLPFWRDRRQIGIFYEKNGLQIRYLFPSCVEPE